MTRKSRPLRDARCSRGTRWLSLVLALSLVVASVPNGLAYSVDQSGPPSGVEAAEPTPADLQQLVAPIALYPDELIAQVLAAATYPEEIVEADRWIQQHSSLQGPELAKEVDAQPWDESVKALAEFPSVLANMDRNLSWTSALGDAYVNHQQNVMDAVQAMRRRAKNAGNLTTSSQQRVVEQASQIAIEPSDPEIIYVPQYNPWLIYGAPVVAWPGWYPYPGLFIADPGIGFGVGFGIGLFAGFGWGWGHWGCDWGHRTVVYNHNIYVSRGRTFVNRRTFDRDRAGFAHGGTGFAHGADGFAHGGGAHRLGSYHGPGAARGGDQHAFMAPREAPNGRWGAFSGFDHGGATRGFSQRGSSSVGGFHGGGFHGGGFGGGFHGGGGHR